MGDAALHCVDTLIWQFDRDIARHIKSICVVARSALHDINPRTTIEHVVPFPSIQEIVSSQPTQSVVAPSTRQSVIARSAG